MAVEKYRDGDKPLDRESLKSLFGKGTMPNADHFSSLIESTINKVDDRISKDIKNGLVLYSEKDSSNKTQYKLLSFKRSIQDVIPTWSFHMPNDKPDGIAFVETISSNEEKPRLFFQKEGNIGINTLAPQTTLDVKGILGADTRVGTYALNTVPADGKWHDIISDVDGCSAFEVVAQVGKKHSGKYALVHAHALSTFGRSRNKIRKTQACYNWWWWNKIAIRWTGSTYNYKLQIRTRSNYGQNIKIKFHITNLWDNDVLKLFNDE